MSRLKRDGNADWFSWTLYSVVGGIAGALFGFAALYRRRGYQILPPEFPYLWLFPLACALILGGVFSLTGDTLLFGDGIRTLPTDRPEHSVISRVASSSMIVGGLALAIGLLVFQ